MQKLRYAIIGAGMMGHEHVRNITMLEHTEITLIVDPDAAMRESATRLAQQLGQSNVSAWGTLEELTLDRLVLNADCAVVVSPNHTHVDVLRSLLPLDLPVLVEKPLCTRAEDTEEILALAAARSAPVWVAMEYRFMPPTARFIHEIKSGAVGSLKMLSIREHRYPFLEKVGDWNRFSANTGGTMVEKCCHYFDLMRLITDSEPVRVFASGGIDVNHLEEVYGGHTPDIIDNAFAIVDFANGMRCSLDLCMFAEGSEPQETITAIGDAGKLEVRIPGPDRFWPDAPPRSAEIIYMQRKAVPARSEAVHVDEKLLAAGDHHGGTYFQHARFAELVRTGGQPDVSVKDGVTAVSMGLAAEQSIRTGGAVML